MSWLYACTIYPLQLFYKYVYLACIRVTGSYGLGLIGLSLCAAVAFVPLGRMAKKSKWKEDHLQDVMRPQLEKIKAQYTGAERQEAIARLYKRYSYHPLMTLRSAIGILLQFPFLTAAYKMVQELTILKGQSFWFIKDLSVADGLWGGVNALPIIMTLINFASIATAPHMRGKERIQAAIIALLFLWLLYGAPSALLIYWTCNNLNYLVQNFVFRDKKSVNYASHKASFISQEGDSFLSIVLLVLTFFVFIPSSLYFANIDEFLVSFADMLPLLMIMSVLVIGIVVFFMNIMRGTRIFRVCAVLVFSVAVALFVQAHFLNPPLPVLNGTTINWGGYSAYLWLSSFVWFAILAVFLLLELNNSCLSRRIRKSCSLFLIGVQLAAMLYTAVSTTKTRNLGGWVITQSDEFNLSKNKNTIVFVLDTLDAQWFEEVLLENNRHTLKDFTYFRNIVAGGAPTVLGMPLLFTGKLYDGKVSLSQYYKDAYASTSLFHDLKHEDCKVKLFTLPEYLDGANVYEIDNVKLGVEYKISSYSRFAFYLFKLAAFNSAPQIVKPLLEFYGDRLTQLVKAEKGNNYMIDDPRFFKELTSGKLQAYDYKNNFILYHMKGAHGYYTMNENCEPIPEKRTNEAWRNQIIGAFKIVTTYLDYMKDIGVYDDSTIIITADHGGVQLYQNPAVLIKLPGIRDQLTVNDAPGTFVELRATIAASLLRDADRYGKTLFDLTSSDNKVRLHTAPKILGHLVFPNDKTVSSRSYTQYTLIGDIRKKQNIHVNYDALRTNLEYNLGTVLSFRAVDTVNSANPFIMLGFSGAEQNFTWTDGRESQMLFKLLPAKANRDLLCKMEYGVYAGPQRVIVNANGKKILEYTAKNHEKKVFFIPKEIIQNDELLLSFSFPDAVSPKKRGESNDARELALSMRSLSISEYYPTECELGKTLFFRTGENSAKPFICSGFSGAEKNFTWTDGHEAQMFFKLPHSSRGKNLICKIEHGTYASKQRVIVKANERIVLEYSTTGHQKKEFVIPAYVVSNDELLLTFILPDAVSPKERGESSDERVLALAMQSLCIDEGHPSGNRMAGGPYEYVMGKLLSFKADVNSAEPFILNGFSRAEKNYTWTNGYEAQMAFKLPRSGNGRKLLCKMKHGTYAVPQRVIVKANGKVVLAYTSTGQQEKEFVIPADAIINDELHLTFVLPDADSPKARGESEDSSEYFTPRKPVVHVKGTTGSRQ